VPFGALGWPAATDRTALQESAMPSIRLRKRAVPSATCLAAASLCALLAPAQAQGVFDPSATVMQRIRANPAALRQLGSNVDLTDLVFVDRQRTQNMVFDFKASREAQPGTVVLQDATASNCVADGMRQQVEVSKTTQLQESFSVTNSIGGSTTVEVGFESPIASAKVSQSFEYSRANANGSSRGEEQSWKNSVDVPVPFGRRVRVQFQVETREYKDVPWSADMAVQGDADVSFADDFEVCVYEHANYQGGKKCWVNKQRYGQVALWAEAYDTGKRIGIPMGDGGTVSSLRTKGSGTVTFYPNVNFKGWTWAQSNTKDFPNLAVGWQGANPNDRFNSMVIQPEATKRRVPIAALLPQVADRSFKLTGFYRGVTGVEGYWVAVDDGSANCEARGIVPSRPPGASAPSGPSTQAVQGNQQLGRLPGGITMVQNSLANAVPIKGTILSRVQPRK
jgi:hypothetical protein